MRRVLFTLMAGLWPCLAGSADEIVFQQGRDGYTGAQDTTLRGDPPEIATYNFGAAEKLLVSGVPWGGWKSVALIRFDQIFGTAPNQVPVGAMIIAASMELHKIQDAPKDQGQYKAAGANAVISLYPLRTDFVAGTGTGRRPEKAACFSYRCFDPELPTFWGIHNQIENGPVADLDYDSQMRIKSPLLPGETNVWMSWDITPIVSGWVQKPDSNHGLYLVTHAYWIGAEFDSSEAAVVSNRPRLVVKFVPPAK